MKTTCVILNGPPGVGKGAISALMSKNFGYQEASLKEAVFQDVASHYDFPVEALKEIHSDREAKEMSQPFLGGNSTREALIHVSERIIKPAKGKDWYGRLLGTALELQTGDWVLDGSGFPEEVSALSLYFDDTYIVRLHREGFEFGTDSRSYLYDKDDNITYLDQTLQEGMPEQGAAMIELQIALHKEGF